MPLAGARFEAVLPAIMKALARAPDSDRAIARFDNMIEAMPSAINVFRLLEARPGLLQLVADILSYAPTLADDLGRQSRYLDALIDSATVRANDVSVVADGANRANLIAGSIGGGGAVLAGLGLGLAWGSLAAGLWV